MGRAPCCEKAEGLRKGAWTAEEDQKLLSFIQQNNGHGSWRTLPKLAGLRRCGKSCRLRWTNYLRPNIKRGNFTPEEERTIIQLHELLGNKWAGIASHLPGRTDNEVKNHWNTHLKKRLSRMGIDPVTHRPCVGSSNSVNLRDCNMLKHVHNSSFSCNHTNTWPKVALVDQSFVSHMAQWELARLEAEARLMAAKSSAYLQYPCSTSQACTNSRGQDKENELLEVFRELLEAPTAHHEESTTRLPSLDTSNNTSSSSACSHFMNEAEITSNLTCINTYTSSSTSSQYHDPLLALPPSSPLPPCEASTHAYWANMLSLVGSVMSSCPC